MGLKCVDPCAGGHQPRGGAWTEGRADGEPRLWLIKLTAGVRPRGRDREREGEETGRDGLNRGIGGPLKEMGRQD